MKRSLYITLGTALLFCSCFNPKKYDDVKPTGLITVTSGDSTVSADGTSAYVVNAFILDKQSDVSKRTIVFTTTSGTFKGGSDSISVAADANFLCSAKLVSAKPGSATVTAKIQNIQASKAPSVTFVTAYPSTLTVSVDSFTVRNNNQSETLVTATLNTSNGGIASIGTLVTLSVTDNKGISVGTFLNGINTAKTDANGQIKLRYAPINTTYTGYLTITATASDASGAPVTGSTQIFVTN